MAEKYNILAYTDQGIKSLLVRANSKKYAKMLAGRALLKKKYTNITILSCKELE